MNLLCLHGFTGNPRVWEPVLEELDGVTAWCPSLLGHEGGEGDSLATAATASVATFEEEVTRLVSWLKARTEEPCILVGYSMGARVGLGMLLKDPSLFAGALLVGVHPGLAEENARCRRSEQDEALARRLESDGVEAFIDHWQEIPLFASQKRLPEEVLTRQRRGRLDHRVDGLAAALRRLGLAQMPEYGRGLQSLHVPVKVMVGEEDTKFLHIAKDMVENLPRGEVLPVPSVGHNVVLEAPGAVAKAVVAALEDSFDD